MSGGVSPVVPGQSSQSSTPSSLPATPSYVGAAAGSTTSSTNNPNDIWGLGALYDQPIYLGTTVRSPRIGLDQSKGSDDIGGSLTGGAYGQTQDLMQQIVDSWAAQDAERVKDPNSLTSYEYMQQALWQAGFYGQTAYKDIHVGQWTKQTQDAAIAALDGYETTRKAGTPITFSEFLQQNAAGTSAGGVNSNTGGGAGAAVQAQLSDPQEIRAVAQNAAQNALGHALTQAQLDKFVSEFQGQQASSQFSTASTATAPNLAAEADTFAQQADPTGYQSYQQDAYTNALVNMFIPSASSRPNITPTPTA